MWVGGRGEGGEGQELLWGSSVAGGFATSLLLWWIGFFWRREVLIERLGDLERCTVSWHGG
jgi:hypothetical protein